MSFLAGRALDPPLQPSNLLLFAALRLILKAFTKSLQPSLLRAIALFSGMGTRTGVSSTLPEGLLTGGLTRCYPHAGPERERAGSSTILPRREATAAVHLRRDGRGVTAGMDPGEVGR